MDQYKSLVTATETPSNSEHEVQGEQIKPRYNCPLCRDAKMVEHPSGGWTRCQCDQLARARKILENSGVSTADSDKTFTSFKHRGIESIDDAKENAMQYFKEFEPIEKERQNSIAFLGKMEGCTKHGVGTGKTHLGIALTNNLLQKGVEVVYMSYREEITRIKQAITDEENYRKAIDRYKGCRVLFIDDLFKGKVTEADINAMFEIVNHRYLCRKPMIITSELDISKLNEIDQAIASRIFEMSKAYHNVMGGKGANYRYQ